MQDTDVDIADLAKALAHPARLRILRLLLATPGCIGGDIVDAVGLAQSTVSEHLRILKAAGVITGEISGPRICYALTPDALDPLTAFIDALTPAARCGLLSAGRKGNPMSLFERWLSLWVGLCIVAGIVLGNLVPGLFGALAGARIRLGQPRRRGADLGDGLPDDGRGRFRLAAGRGPAPKGLVITLVVNWLIKPFTMAALGVLFFNHLFAGLIDAAKAPEYIAGLILLGAAPCTAMVFVWSQLTKGDPNYTLVQVSVNDLIMVVAFAPIVAFLLGVTVDHGAVGDADPVGRALRRDPADRRGDHPPGADRAGRRERAVAAFTAPDQTGLGDWACC